MSLYEALRPHRSTAERTGGSAGVAGRARCLAVRGTGAAGRGRLCPPGSFALTVVRGDRRRQPHHRDRHRPRPRRRRRTSRTRAGAHPRPKGVQGIAGGRGGTAAQDGGRGRVAVDQLLLAALRPVDTATAPLPPASSPRSPVRSLRRPDASTPAGTGSAVGRHVPLADLAGDVVDGPAIVSVDDATDFEVAAREISDGGEPRLADRRRDRRAGRRRADPQPHPDRRAGGRRGRPGRSRDRRAGRGRGGRRRPRLPRDGRSDRAVGRLAPGPGPDSPRGRVHPGIGGFAGDRGDPSNRSARAARQQTTTTSTVVSTVR